MNAKQTLIRALGGGLCWAYAGLAQAQAPVAAPVPSAPEAYAAVRTEFVQQLQALEAMPAPGAVAPTDSAALRDYPLYPWLEAQRLRTPMRYGLPPDDERIAAFLLRHGDAPWTRELRRDWLALLARRGAWPLFQAHYLESRADARLRCERLNGLVATTPPEPAALATLERSILDLWMTGTQLPEACVAPFDWARGRGWLTPERLEQRTRLALEAGNLELADFLLKSLPADRAPPLATWARLLRAPEREIDALVARGGAALLAVEPAALAAGVGKLARNRPDAAAPRIEALASACGTPCALRPPATLPELRRDLALGYAWSRMDPAVAAFRAVDESAQDERSYEWRVRAALWAGDWKQASVWLERQPPALAAQPRWRYWKARAMAQLGDPAGARAAYESLLQENSYYALLAARQLGRGYAPSPKPAPKDVPMQQQLAVLPGVVRTRELWLAQRGDWSAVEWSEVLSTLDNAQLQQAARLAQTWGGHLQTVVAASKAQLYDDFELLYPRPFAAEVAAAVTAARVPAEWIYAVMRQESLYDPRARSKADAMGLLQLLSGTARDVARRSGLPQPAPSDLFDPATNLRLGTLHLRELLGRYDDEFVLVLGAYNAGPRPVERWRPARTLDADIWIENVPYNETRNYIQRVIWHSSVFNWLGGGRMQTLDGLLRPITPPQAP